MENNVQFLNRITLRGYVGAISINSSIPLVRLQVVTNFGHKYTDKDVVVETTFMSVAFFPPKDKMDKYIKIKRGDKVKIIGRLRNLKKVLDNGQRVDDVEVIASSLQKLKVNGPFLLQV